MHFQLPKPLHGWREFAGEVGVIVLGVLIALGAGQAVEWVHDRQEQHQTLERLFQESRANVVLLSHERDSLATESQREEQFAAALTHGSCPPAEQWAAVRDMTRYPQVAVETSIYDEVVGSGGLATIKSTKVREAISDFHSKLAWVESTTDFFRSKAERPFDEADPRVTITFDRGTDEANIAFDREALCRDKGFRNRVAVGVRNRVAWAGFHGPVLQSAIALCTVLGRELGEKCTPSEDAEQRWAEAQGG